MVKSGSGGIFPLQISTEGSNPYFLYNGQLHTIFLPISGFMQFSG